jgi:alkylation response protein AidB-like acyl-CoA dehydrogenase
MAKDTLVERVRALTPQIAAIARNTELARKPDDGIMALLGETGLFRALTPKRWGGLEIDLASLREVVELISEACMSTGWVAAFYTGHNLFVSRFSEQAQADVYASGPDCRVPASVGSLMNVIRVAGGWEISGRATWGTGIMHADWVIVGAPTDEGVLCFVVPGTDTRFDENWQMCGMAGTGSNDIIIDKAFVPSHRALPFAGLMEGGTEGGRLHGNPLYTMPLMPFIYSEVCGVFTGGLRGALGCFEATIRDRVLASVGQGTRERPQSHIQLGNAVAASLIADAVADQIVRSATQGAAMGFDLQQRLQLKAQMGFLVDLCRKTVNGMMNRAGAASFQLEAPLQRFFRDLNTAAIHAFWDWEAGYEQLGRYQLQLEPNNPLI